MMDGDKANSVISIDLKKSRIRIYKSTLHQLNDPQYIQLLVNPTDRILAIRGDDSRCKESHEVCFSRLRPDICYELYSKQLVRTLMTLIPGLEKNYTYRFTGKVLEAKRIALFALDTYQRVEGGI